MNRKASVMEKPRVSPPVSGDTDIVDRALEVAREAVLNAGKFLKKKQGKVRVLQKKSLHDDLLDADLEAERRIITILRNAFPTHDIVSEESEVINFGSPYQWIIDPLDGSSNFQHGLSTFGVSICLLANKVATVSVIYFPCVDEMFTAVLRSGAQLNDRQIHVSSTARLDDAIVHIGDFTKDGNVSENSAILSDIAHLANSVARVRMIGTAAADLAYIACGRADALVVHNALPWDIEVGRLLVTEAGGEFSQFENGAGKSLTICSNANIHSSLIEVINEDVLPEIGRWRKMRVPV
jgi:myo-inositol-1(or 4)-monophosphatase